MKRIFWNRFVRNLIYTSLFLSGFLWIVSCEDPYPLDNTEPNWLGASIYDYLNDNGNYKYFVQIINDVGYKEVLQKTGSKTLFVANDSAFERFFQDNPWGVSSFKELTLTQKKLILNFNMINNAYLIETLSNYFNGIDMLDGQAMRQTTAISVFDSLLFEKGEALPNGPFWQPYKNTGIHLVKDQTSWPIVYFLEKQMENAKISNEDFTLMTGVTRNTNDAHVFNDKIISRDITCKNGYINVLENVLIPHGNMADFIQKNQSTSLFSSLLNRYCAPYYYSQGTLDYRKIHPNFTDSVFIKKYYAVNGGATAYPNGKQINPTLLLTYDPGWNSYYYSTPVVYHPLETDMATMFAPTNEAINNYFNNGNGRILKERYGSWDNVPDDILILFIKRHMRSTYLESIPSRFDKMMDDENFPVPAQKSDVVGTYIGVNGLVYVVNAVYPPPDYESVYAPVLFSEKTKIFNWAIINNEFRLYLNAMSKGINYSFLVPTDNYLNQYIDPVTLGKNIPGALKYWYNDKTYTVNATVYKYNTQTKELGDSVGVIANTTFISNRLLDLLDNHIVVGDIESGKGYYITKGGNFLKINGTGSNMEIKGGGDIELGQKARVTDIYPLSNGKTYLIDKPIQTPFRSVYNILSSTPEFNEFFKLLTGFPPSSSSVIFVKKTSFYGIDYSIKFFNTFNYTVYVPTNEAIQTAIANGIITPWESQNGITGINDLPTQAQKDAAMLKLERFLRYHFQDNSVFISGNPVNELYATATIKNDDLTTAFHTFKNKYYRIKLTGAGDGLVLNTENYGTANVVTQNGLYNIQARDYIFNFDPRSFKEIDGSGSGTDYSSSQIYTSSAAVIHQIDNVLQFQ